MGGNGVISLLFMTSMLALQCCAKLKAAPSSGSPQNSHPRRDHTYDFIIVGGGTSGCTLATRLSKYFSVLLIEAGSWPGGSVNVPGFALVAMQSRKINYRLHSTPQKNAGLGRRKGVLVTTVGKMLGGSSSHNHGVWEHGNAKDYDRWAELTQDKSWRYKNLEKYFKKIENQQGTTLPNDGKSGQSGQLNVIQSSLSLGVNFWLQAGQELGYKIREPNQPQSVGFNQLVYSSLNGQRASTFTAYLDPIIEERFNRLKILTKAHVIRVLFDKKVAIGVKYKRGGVIRTAWASKEIILAASSMLTPIILFQSGIGPKDQIRAAKAPTHIADLPVGKNLHDHTFVVIPPIFINNASLTWRLDRNLTLRDYRNYKKYGEGSYRTFSAPRGSIIGYPLGPLTTTYHGAEAFIMSKSGGTKLKKNEKDSWPDLQIFYEPTAIKKSSVTGVIFHVRPLSRGVLTINPQAKKMADKPKLNYKFFDQKSDVDALIEGINFFLKVMEDTTPFKKLGARLGLKQLRDCKKHEFRSTNFWKCFIRYKAHGGYHTVGTCRMGFGSSDPEAVVDSKLRVIGVQKLRVVDASIMPHITNANTYAPTMVIAEKAADEILKEYFSFISE